MAAFLVVNFLQHDGCDSESEINHSRNFTSKIGNWFFFNNGFHTVHHLHPECHWSQLPKLHKETVKSHIQPHLDQPSIFIFALKAQFEKKRR